MHNVILHSPNMSGALKRARNTGARVPAALTSWGGRYRRNIFLGRRTIACCYRLEWLLWTSPVYRGITSWSGTLKKSPLEKTNRAVPQRVWSTQEPLRWSSYPRWVAGTPLQWFPVCRRSFEVSSLHPSHTFHEWGMTCHNQKGNTLLLPASVSTTAWGLELELVLEQEERFSAHESVASSLAAL